MPVGSSCGPRAPDCRRREFRAPPSAGVCPARIAQSSLTKLERPNSPLLPHPVAAVDGSVARFDIFSLTIAAFDMLVAVLSILGAAHDRRLLPPLPIPECFSSRRDGSDVVGSK
jgi:hypothetical protein